MEQHPFDDAELEPSLRGQDGDAEPQHGHDRLAALAQHIVEASGGNHEHGALGVEQTLDDQQAGAAVDLLSFANESGPSFSENYNLEGLLDQQQQNQARQALAQGGGEEHRDFGGVGVGAGGYNMDESLSGAYNYHQEVGNQSQHQGSDAGADKPLLDEESQGEGQMGKKRKRKPMVGEDAVKHKKEIHKEVERRRRAMINEGIEGLVQLLPQPDKQKGAILVQTAAYIRELQDEVRQKNEEAAIGGLRYETEIKELQNALAAAEAKYTNEHTHAQRLETAWRDAEVKVSAMRMELDALRAKQAQ